MINKNKLEECVGKDIKIIFNSGEEYSGLCTEYIEPMEEDEEPMIFCNPNLAVKQSEIKEIIEVIEDTK